MLWSLVLFVPGAMALAFSSMAIVKLGPSWAMACIALGGLAMLLLAVYQFGIALARPVGLRMDHQGISGFYLAPLSWQDVREVTLHMRDAYNQHSEDFDADATPPGSLAFLALKLKDRDTWWFENTTMQRILFVLRGRPKGWDALIPLGTLAMADYRALVDTACDLHEGRLRTDDST